MGGKSSLTSDVHLLVQALELKGANGVTTPGENETRGQEEDNEVELGPEEATNYRYSRQGQLPVRRPARHHVCGQGVVPRHGKTH